MDIILLKNVDKVGKKFEVATVKAGYGRNFLIPQGLALVANKANRNNLESFKRQEAAKLNKRLEEFKAIAEKVNGKLLEITVKAGTSGKIFGSVTTQQISHAIMTQLGAEVDRRDVILPENVKMLGKYTATLDLHPDVDAKVDFEVIGDDGQRAVVAEATEAVAEAPTTEEA